MNVYVGNLALEVTEDELRQEFVSFGEVVSVTIMNDKYIGSGQSRRYGFVEMPSKAQSEAAVAALNGKYLRHRTVNVVLALPLSNFEDSVSHRHTKSLWTNPRVRERGEETTSHVLGHGDI
jgi:RNA recognition motif-containing protein